MVALAHFRAARISTERDLVRFENSRLAHQSESALFLYYDNAVRPSAGECCFVLCGTADY